MNLIISIFMAIILSIFSLPSAGIKPEADLRLKVDVISDTHIKRGSLIGEKLLKKGLENMADASVKADALVIAGDLTELAREDEYETFFEVLKESASSDSWAFALGNHDTTRAVDFSPERAKEIFLENYNKYAKAPVESCYYSIEVKGYSFIVLEDERTDDDLAVEISQKQLEFLDRALEKATADNKPAFVVCHYPLTGVNGQQKVDLVTFDAEGSEKVRAILEKYKNVFMLTGHLHTGINGGVGDDIRGFSQLETINGVTYVSLPAFGSFNLYGIIGFGNGYIMEVYDHEVVFRANNYVTGKWHGFSDFTVKLV